MASEQPKTTPPCVLFEDEHLLVVDKPAGLNTHAPSPFAGEGLYDWLRQREPRWADLAIIHRLDKETGGVLVFGKTPLANKSLTDQFTRRVVRKKYLLLTDRPVKQRSLTVVSALVRAGEKYLGRPLHAGAERAETRFEVAGSDAGTTRLAAEPVTGRTHQIRVHAADSGFPILGDTLYGGSPFARVCLQAVSLTLQHPATGKTVTFETPAEFAEDSRQALRAATIEPELTDSGRLIHGASDGEAGWYVERLGDFVLSQSEQALSAARKKYLATLPGVRGVYHKILNRQLRRAAPSDAAPQWVSGETAPDRFVIRENGLRFELSFSEGYSVGLFLDQRDNRRRLLTGHIAAEFPLFNSKPETRNPKPEILNTFAYTCGFSVAAARGGARTTSLDLSKKYLEWGRRNFALNGLDATEHEFIHGDAFDWLRRLAKKGRSFAAIVLDPPTFSQAKGQGVFRAEKDYGRLVHAALPLLQREGVLLASTNAAAWAPEEFLATVEKAIQADGRKILRRHYAPQPPDFPVSRVEPAYLKTAWWRLA